MFPKTVKVGSKNTTEQILLGEILAQCLEKKTTFKVERRLGLGDSAIVHQAAISGDVDIFAEDTATATSVVIKENVIMDAGAMLERVRNEYARLYGLQISKPLGATAGAVMVVSKSIAAKEKLTDLSSAAASRTGWRLGVTEDFAGRRDGLSLFSTAYKLVQQQGPRTMEPANEYQALTDGQVNMISAVETDGMLTEPTMQILTDDKRIFPPSQICFVIRRDASQKVAGLDAAVERMAGKVSTADLRRMGREALVNKRPIAVIAREFLLQAGLD